MLLNHAGDHVGRWVLRDKQSTRNERLRIHRSVDVDDNFVQAFFDERSDFESRAALLASLLGLNVLSHGRIAHLRDQIDLIAASDQMHIYAIECTTGDINQRSKLQSLSDHIGKIRGNLDAAQISYMAIIPMLVTSLRRAETAIHHAHAAALGISIICREELEFLLERLDVPPSAQEIYELALRAVPPIATVTT